MKRVSILGTSATGQSAPPVFLFLPPHRLTCWVFHLEPVGRPAAAIGGVPAPRHDAFESHLAGVGEHRWPIGFYVLVEAHAGCGPS